MAVMAWVVLWSWRMIVTTAVLEVQMKVDFTDVIWLGKYYYRRRKATYLLKLRGLMHTVHI